MKIFYFTATGNSLYISKRLGGKLISIPQIINSRDLHFYDDVIGIVCPCYAGGIPRIVKRFLDKVDLKANYCFAIMTYGNEITSSLDQMRKYAEKKGIKFNYMNKILMVNNYLPMFKIEDEQKKVLEKDIESALTVITNDIYAEKQFISPASFSNKFWGMVFRSGAEKMTGENADQRFSVDNTCTSCHTCIKVCSASNLSFNSTLNFNHKCEGCLACIHHCPSRAIKIKGEKSAERFRNESVDLDEIMGANYVKNQDSKMVNDFIM